MKIIELSTSGLTTFQPYVVAMYNWQRAQQQQQPQQEEQPAEELDLEDYFTQSPAARPSSSRWF